MLGRIRPFPDLPALAAVLLAVVRPCAAQIPVTLRFDSVIYADNNEFDGPLRSGETILGSFQQLFFDIAPNDRTVLRVGAFAVERAGSHAPVDHLLPIVALRWENGRQRFILGTLDSADRRRPLGPDRETPHGLLPALAVETAWFTRAYEAGGQWQVRTGPYGHDAWFDYQMEDTPAHREKFDVGAVGRARLAGPLAFAYQLHLVHHGGQQFDTGPVSDSLGLGPGVMVEGRVGRFQSASLEVYGLAAYDRPDRAAPARTVRGKGAFLRAAVETLCWRAHLIVWRGDNFNHEDADPNYLSRFPDGSQFRHVRDYSEAGVARLFRLAPGVDFQGSFRLHRVESRFAYSYRLVAIVHLGLWKTTLP